MKSETTNKNIVSQPERNSLCQYAMLEPMLAYYVAIFLESTPVTEVYNLDPTAFRGSFKFCSNLSIDGYASSQEKM